MLRCLGDSIEFCLMLDEVRSKGRGQVGCASLLPFVEHAEPANARAQHIIGLTSSQRSM